MRRFAHGPSAWIATLAVVLLPALSFADAVDLEADEIGRVVAGDSALAAKPIVKVGVVVAETDVKFGVIFQGSLARLGYGSIMVPTSQPERAKGADILYYASEAPDPLVLWAAENDVLTFAKNAAVTEAGRASLSVAIVDGTAHLTVHFPRLVDEGHALNEETLTKAKIIGRPAEKPSEPKPASPETPVDSEKPKNAPPYVLEQSLISKFDPKLPASVLAAHKGKNVESTVLVCVQKSGAVDPKTSRVLKTVPGAAEAVMEAVLKWQYKPQPIPVCAPVRLVIAVQ